MGSQVVSASSSNSRLINWDNSSVRVSNKSSIRSIASSIGNWSSSSVNSTINSLGSKMVSTGSSNSWFINRNNSSVRMSNKVGVQVERSSIAVAKSSNGSSRNRRGSYEGSSSNNGSRSSIFSSLGLKVSSTSSSNSWLIKRNNSSVRMSNELSVQVKRTSIAITSSICWGLKINCWAAAGCLTCCWDAAAGKDWNLN